jgi:hypothetical protein
VLLISLLDVFGAVWQWAGAKWALLAVAVVATTGWALELRPLATVWGPVGTWVGGLATSAGVIFAGIQIRDARLQRKGEEEQRLQELIEHRERMARSVSVNTVVKGLFTNEGVVVAGSRRPRAGFWRCSG